MSPKKTAVITAQLNTVYVQKGEEKTVEVTPQIQALIDSGRLQDVTPAPPRKPRAKKEEVETVEPSNVG